MTASPAPNTGNPALRTAPVSPSGRPEALAMLLTGRPRPEDPAVPNFLKYAAQHGLSLSGLWAGRQDGRVVTAALVVPGVGKTAVAFVSPIAGRRWIEPTASTLSAAISQIDGEAVRLVQMLLDPGEALRTQTIQTAGFRFLAELIYMQRSIRQAEQASAPTLDGRPLEPVLWSEQHRSLFRQAIDESYEDTLDCPGLLGLRETDDIIAGHRNTGEFTPEHWKVWTDRGEPIAITLLAKAAEQEGHELVYLGVVKRCRGQGLGLALMRQILADLSAIRSKRLFLAVDERNRPAMKLYRDLGFRSIARKVAWIYIPQRQASAAIQ
jgi:ribosomal protein S18 acetylase RimI-like enzyme